MLYTGLVIKHVEDCYEDRSLLFVTHLHANIF